MEDASLEPALPRKEQEFIDHSLLAPTYIRDSNNFIIDLMEHPTQIVFPKNVVPSIAPGNSAADSYAIKVSSADALPPDLQFHNTIFHFRQVPPEVGVAEGADALTLDSQPVATAVVNGANVDSDSANGYKHATDFISLSSDFLSTNEPKSYCDAVTASQGTNESVPQFLLAPPNVSLDETNVLQDDDVLFARSNARKVLPHKKRISRKLRVSQSCDDDVLPAPLGVHKLQDEEERLSVGSLTFSCELCGHTAVTQLQFFAHLKQHYEPTTPDTLLAAMKTTLDDLQPNKDCENLCQLSKKASDNNVDQVFNDVHLNFDDFHSVDETVRHVMNTSSQEEDIKILNANGISKCIDYVTQADTAPLKNISTEEVEFSDTEDMLEGIRNVVDKVSIEDTCDDIDLMGANGIRAPWFTSDNFSGITFKSKPFGDDAFSEPLTRMPVMESNDLNGEAKEHLQMNASVSDMSYAKDDYAPDKVTLNLPAVEADVRRTFDTLCVKSNEVSETVELSQQVIVQEPMCLRTKNQTENFGYVVEDTITASSPSEGHPSDVDSEQEHYEEDGAEDEEEQTYTTDEKTGKKQYICTKCYRQFNSSNALKYHSRTHSGVRPHTCELCGKSFFAQGALKSHMRTHTGDKPFECEYCQRKFRQWGDLKYHTISIHTEEKSHQCEFCGKAFSRKYSLVLHRRIHTSERNYKCDFCSKTFRASTYLQNHRKIHTGEKPHECEVCNKRFRVSGDLRRHMRIHQRKSPTKADTTKRRD